MNVIVWLERYEGIEANISSLSKTKDKFEFSPLYKSKAALADYKQLIEEIETETEKSVKVQHEILSAISRLQSNINKTILREHYINRTPWEEVAEIIGYSDKWTKGELLKRACRELIFRNPELELEI